MQELKGLCKNCFGCNKLLNINFIGINKCDNYRGDKNEISKQKNNSKWNKI